MTPVSDARARDAIASEWVAREDFGLADGQRQARDAWLSADARNLGAYARARAVSAQASRAVAAMRGGDAGTTWRSNRRRWAVAAAAAMAVLACLAYPWLPLAEGGRRTLSTERGEVLRVPLPDGSVVTLDSATELVVDYAARRRGIRLLRGEALFDVAKDRERPFVVSSARATVTAVGTSFSVAAPQGPDKVMRVLVREGKVDVAAGGGDRIARVEANQAAAAGPDLSLRIERLPAAVVRERLAWRDGMLAFQGETLASAAERFRRYSQVRIVIDDPELASRRVVGLYSANDPAGFARSVALSFGVMSEQRGDVIHLRAPGSPGVRKE